MLDEKSTEELIKDLLEKRGQESQHQIEKFMNPEYKDFKNPFDFENMEKIVNRIISARENKEKIFEDRLSYPWNWIPDSWTVCTFYCNSNRVCSAGLFYGSYSFE